MYLMLPPFPMCICQILVADLWAAYGYLTCGEEKEGIPLGAFRDIHKLTMFGACVLVVMCMAWC